MTVKEYMEILNRILFKEAGINLFTDADIDKASGINESAFREYLDNLDENNILETELVLGLPVQVERFNDVSEYLAGTSDEYMDFIEIPEVKELVKDFIGK